MKLKISTPTKVVYQGEIQEITVPTESGDILITKNQIPLVSPIKPGIIKFLLSTFPYEFSSKNESIAISVGKGMLFVDGKIVRIVTSVATMQPVESEDMLIQIKEMLENRIKKLKAEGSLEAIDKELDKLEKVNADIKLKRMLQTA
ncbi:MAG: F0F1 ATP synthase subunit epsilon [Candidatus Absconditabacterales bacterium]